MKTAITTLLVVSHVLIHEISGAGKYRGINRSGSEYSCLSSNNVFEGPTDQASVNAMKSWKINMVRIPLNSDCWLGNNGRAGISGNYKSQIKGYVDLLLRNGISVILVLMWSNGRNLSGLPNPQAFCKVEAANCLKPMPDATQSPKFWKDVATTFKYNNEIYFDLFNEPFPDRVTNTPRTYREVWNCWRNGGRACYWITYPCTGMQHLVNVVRITGARNPIMIGGTNFANDINGWLQFVPRDPFNKIYASFHVYKNNYFNNIRQFGNTVRRILGRYPLIVGEFGEGDCAHTWVDPVMRFFDAVGVSYCAWTWNLWGCNTGNNALITDYSGNPTGYGQGIKNHFLSI